MYASQIITPMPIQNVSYILPQTQQFIPVQPQLTQSFIQTPQVPMNYIMNQRVNIAQTPSAMAYARYIPPTPTCSTSTPPKIYQFYKYVDVPMQQSINQIPQYQITTLPLVNNGSYIIQ